MSEGHIPFEENDFKIIVQPPDPCTIDGVPMTDFNEKDAQHVRERFGESTVLNGLEAILPNCDRQG